MSHQRNEKARVISSVDGFLFPSQSCMIVWRRPSMTMEKRKSLLIVVLLLAASASAHFVDSFAVVKQDGGTAATKMRTRKIGHQPQYPIHSLSPPLKTEQHIQDGIRTHIALSYGHQEDEGDLKRNTKSSSSSRTTLLSVAAVALSLAVGSAKLGFLPGPPQSDGTLAPYPDALILQDIGSTLLTAVLGYAFVSVNTFAVRRDWLDPRDARKIIHTLSAPLFMLFWPVFSTASGARFFCAIVPTINAVRLYLASTTTTSTDSATDSDNGGGGETDLARAVSRSGDASEALGGPFIYVIILAACILTFWRDSAVGVVALSNLAAGDGLADLLGRRFGKSNPWPGIQSKSIAGTVAFWLGATTCSYALILWLQYCDVDLHLPAIGGTELFARVAGISAAAAFMELVPLGDDNYTVPLVAAVLSLLFLT